MLHRSLVIPLSPFVAHAPLSSMVSRVPRRTSKPGRFFLPSFFLSRFPFRSAWPFLYPVPCYIPGDGRSTGRTDQRLTGSCNGDGWSVERIVQKEAVFDDPLRSIAGLHLGSTRRLLDCWWCSLLPFYVSWSLP